MKKIFWILPLILLACSDENIYEERWLDSRTKWNDLKAQHGNSYFYTVSTSSWTGYGTQTKLKIEAGVVTERVYEQFFINPENGEREIQNSYTETILDLGSHNAGAELKSIDDLYKSCSSNYLRVDESTHTIYFETDANGVMNLCGYVPRNCADDCFNGIRIASLDWI